MKLSDKRRERVARVSHAISQKFAPNKERQAAVNWRIALIVAILSIATAFAESVIFDAVSGWLKFPGLDSGLCIFTSVVATFAVAVLYSAGTAIAGGLAASLLLWGLWGFNPCTLISTLSSTIVVALTAKRVKKAADLMLAVIYAFFVQVILCSVAVAICFAKAATIETCEGWQIIPLLASNIIAMPIAYFIARPLAEKVFGRTATCTLVPYANLENPLLLRLAREAPGTYGHSMVVADLAAAAASAIGADPILARIGGYYHDIGKLSNPKYFMENQTLLGNPHDALPPSVSAMIISSHVKDGLILAREAGLPAPVLQIIATHHGTSAMEWFRRKAEALARQRGESAVADAWPYRYNGSLPQTEIETIVSIADSVEAASRSIQVPTKTAIAKMVEKIVTARLADGQLAKSALSLDDLESVKNSLVLTLVHRLHVRAAYPGK